VLASASWLAGWVRIEDGTSALVTGGASGLGRATAEALARRGVNVVAIDRAESAAIDGIEFLRADARGSDAVLAAIENPMLNGEVLRLDGAVRMAPR
jgi:NAD(P)-dependent dehydrogenase (short-subunit alcohol dehydrogenase family)